MKLVIFDSGWEKVRKRHLNLSAEERNIFEKTMKNKGFIAIHCSAAPFNFLNDE